MALKKRNLLRKATDAVRDFENFWNLRSQVDIDANRHHIAGEITHALDLPLPGETKEYIFPEFAIKTPENLDQPELSILTWNVQKGGDKLPAQITYLRTINPDILLLQELTQFPDDAPIELIAENLGYPFASFAPEFVELQEGREGVIGQAIFSKYPLENIESVALDRAYGWENSHNRWARLEPRTGHRNIHRATAKIGNREVTIFNCHTEIFNDINHRAHQYEQIKRLAREAKNPIICGDLNTVDVTEGLMTIIEPIAGGYGGIKELREDFYEIITNLLGGLYNKMSEAGGIPSAAAAALLLTTFRDYQGAHDITEPTIRLFKGLGGSFRLDHILVPKEEFEVHESAIGPWGLSDHRPLSTKLKLL